MTGFLNIFDNKPIYCDSDTETDSLVVCFLRMYGVSNKNSFPKCFKSFFVKVRTLEIAHEAKGIKV